MSEERWTDSIPSAYVRCIIVNSVRAVGVRRAVMSLAGLVSDIFGVGHTHAAELCRRAGLNPDVKAAKATVRAQPK